VREGESQIPKFNSISSTTKFSRQSQLNWGIQECAQVFGSMPGIQHKVTSKLCYLEQIKTVVLVFTFQRLFKGGVQVCSQDVGE